MTGAWLLAALIATANASPPPADPLTATIHTGDVARFAAVFAAAGGRPTADQLQRGYLDGASPGVAVFTPHRIVNAAHLAQAVAADPDRYRRALATCLPEVAAADGDLRAIDLALHGLLPDAPLPQVYLVVGAGNSGGTAGPNAQVLGLEVLCGMDTDPGAFRATLRTFFAHETVHTFQTQQEAWDTTPAILRSPLLAHVLMEGAADFVATMVTGAVPDPARAAWAAPREATLWAQFRADMVATAPDRAKADPHASRTAWHRWVENYDDPPPGWPGEAGYWIGMRIWESWYRRQPDKHRAIRDLLGWTDPEQVLRDSGYGGPPATVPATP